MIASIQKITDLRAVRDGVFGRGTVPVEVESVTITLTRWRADVDRHAISCNVTTSVVGEGAREVNTTDTKDLHEAVRAFATRADLVGASGAKIAWEIAAGLD